MLRLIRALPNVDARVILAEDGPLVTELASAGAAVEILPLKRNTRELGRRRVTLTRLPIGTVCQTVRYSVQLARAIGQIKPDVIHTNSMKAGIYGTLAAALTQTPLVWHLRDRLASDYMSRFAQTTVRLLSRRADALICNSETTRDALGRSADTFVIPSPLATNSNRTDGTSARCQRDNDPLRVGTVGRLTAWKGQRVFLRAFALAFPDGDAHAVIIGGALFGSDEDRYAEGLVELAATLGIGERVEFRGHRTNIDDELARLDILVHASTIPEPFGQVVVEGMAAGLPVVASDAGGPAETIEDGVDGLLFGPGNTLALAELLRRLAADQGLRVRLGAAAKASVIRFRPEPIAAQTMDVYATAMRRHQSISLQRIIQR